MTTGLQFEALSNAINENNEFALNQKGQQLVQQYHELIKKLEEVVLPVVTDYVKDPVKIAQQQAVQTVSIINSTKEGNELFDIMSRLDTLTNGGKTPIQKGTFTFNQGDKILEYLENT